MSPKSNFKEIFSAEFALVGYMRTDGQTDIHEAAKGVSRK